MGGKVTGCTGSVTGAGAAVMGTGAASDNAETGEVAAMGGPGSKKKYKDQKKHNRLEPW